MNNLVVVNFPKAWDFNIKGAQVVSARDYLTDPHYVQLKKARVFNLCRSYSYQSLGYYVSLLATARGHRPLPSITTIQDMKSSAIVRLTSDDIDELIQESLAPIHSTRFTLSVYFGRNLARRYDRLGMNLFKAFQAPLLRAYFAKDEGEWQLLRITPIPNTEIPESHKAFVMKVAEEYFAEDYHPMPKRKVPPYTLAILRDPEADISPSNNGAIRKFTQAARRMGMGVEMIEKDDYGRLAEFDALFIREDTSVNHYTYRFARRALAEGLVVIDDPESIVKCTNKVYLAEILQRNGIATPRTLIVHRDNREQVASAIGFPCILKKPDSSFSMGVVKVNSDEELQAKLDVLLDESELVIAQEFLPTTFDWRVGVLDRRVLYVAKYHMAQKHWQIRKEEGGEAEYGRVQAMYFGDTPRSVLRMGLRAANLIGDGLYGVDLKQIGRKIYVIEVNDNPNIDHGYEDAILKDDLFLDIMESFRRRIELKKTGRAY